MQGQGNAAAGDLTGRLAAYMATKFIRTQGGTPEASVLASDIRTTAIRRLNELEKVGDVGELVRSVLTV